MLWTYDMMSFQKIYSPTQLANAMKLVRAGEKNRH